MMNYCLDGRMTFEASVVGWLKVTLKVEIEQCTKEVTS